MMDSAYSSETEGLLSRSPISGSRDERFCVALALLSSLVGLYWVSRFNYLLFHSLTEIYHVAVFWGIFFVTWSARRLLRNNYLCVLGVSSLFLGFLNLLHMLAYRGMGVFPGAMPNLPTQLWIATRSLHALAFVAASLCLFRPRHNITALLPAAAWGLLTLLFTVLIFTGHFPDCFVEGQGLTPFKKSVEIGAVFLFALAALLTWIKREKMDIHVLRLLAAALLLTTAAGLMFIFYTKVNGIANMLGHLFNLGSTYCVFRAFIRTGITAPQQLLFYELNRRQEELEQIKEGLEQQVRERTETLEEKNKELEATNQRLNEFAYSISHDLREPLRGMYNFAHFLADDYRDKIDGDGRDMLDGIMRLAKRLDAQVLGVLKYSRIARLDLELRSVKLDALLNEVLDGLADMITLNKVRVKRLLPLPQVVCHGEYVREVLHNLISNGIIYNDKTKKEISIGWYSPDALPENIPLATSALPIFFVRDNGIGIPEKHFQKIFGIFRRLHGQDKYGGGTGVGLTIARQVIERHGGQITLESEPGKGTTFYFTLSAGKR
ncbi:MAG: His Kinase A (phospho-acceptor) domain-containing protein [Candidatus Electronema aureum]|uniref:histidine kinase n=1 Tax=Candidatus Electronema aureum TaxID=2005002 RepID=A0A521FZG2_9BACT|nr:MAG: His Kinase A (phospho-acceptor) domain-containing protein [Candidatus Electronema aureum]